MCEQHAKQLPEHERPEALIEDVPILRFGQPVMPKEARFDVPRNEPLDDLQHVPV